jgi:hypothetical protein
MIERKQCLWATWNRLETSSPSVDTDLLHREKKYLEILAVSGGGVLGELVISYDEGAMRAVFFPNPTHTTPISCDIWPLAYTDAREG